MVEVPSRVQADAGYRLGGQDHVDRGLGFGLVEYLVPRHQKARKFMVTWYEIRNQCTKHAEYAEYVVYAVYGQYALYAENVNPPFHM